MTELPFRTALAEYELQAEALLAGWRAGDAVAVDIFRHNHPRLLDEETRWLPRDLTETELRRFEPAPEDARLATARWYSFQDWDRLAEWVEAVRRTGSDVERFESAVEAVIHGDAEGLARKLGAEPELVRARSTIVTAHDPPEHRATLLHYLAANGVEGYRQRSPLNAVEIARLLLEAGAEPDALAAAYGGEWTTMGLLVSSSHPAEAGVQVPLVEVLVDYGASVEAVADRDWGSPLTTALIFGYLGAAEALVRRGARINSLPAAAGLGRVEESRRLLPESSPEDRHRGLALAAQLGQVETVRLLLDAGEDPDRYNLPRTHAHATPMHLAALAGHGEVVKLLAERGARLDIRDTLWKSTPLGWAEHGKQAAVADYLRSRGATM